MNKEYKSIFSNPKLEDEPLWRNTLSNFEFEEILFEGEAFKIKFSTKKFCRRWYVITKTFLYYKQNKGSQKVAGIIDLRRCTVRFNPPESSNSPFECVISVVKDGKFTRIFVRREEEILFWRKAFTPTCLFDDLPVRYVVNGEIGKGAFGKVRDYDDYIF